MQTRIPLNTSLGSDPRLTLTSNDLALAQESRFPVVAHQKRGRDGLGMAAGIIAALALGAVTLISMSNTRRQKNTPTAVDVAEAAPIVKPLVTPPQVLQVPPPPPVQAAPPTLPQQPVTIANPNPAIDRARAPVLVMDNYNNQPVLPAVKAAGDDTRPTPKGTPAGLNVDESFAFRVGEASVDRAVATPLSNPSTTVVQGTMMAAVLETGINSDLPGYVRAFISQDVRGFDNKTVLIPRGSRLIGQYKSGVSAGQTRAFVMWSRLLRPDGVTVAIASPSTDLAGENGLPGDVNSHFMKRFGSAMLLSVLGGLASSGNNIFIASSASSAVAVAAQSNAAIPPTIRVAQGQPIRIFTARDLDFENVTPVASAP